MAKQSKQMNSNKTIFWQLVHISSFENIRVYAIDIGQFKHGAAMAIPGIGIFVGKKHINNIDLLRHEFGHILQYRKWGWLKFWTNIVPKSIRSASIANKDSTHKHMHLWTEWTANQLSYHYFNKPTDWNHRSYPISENKRE